MSKFIKQMMRDNTRTFNYALTHSTSDSAIIDLFFLMGAARNISEDDIKTLLNEALEEDKDKTLKLLVYARDIAEGLGERRFFRIFLKYLQLKNYDDELNKLIKNIPSLIKEDIIRADDFIDFANYLIKKEGITKKISRVDDILNQLFELLSDDKISAIVAKWMPRKSKKHHELVLYMRKHGFISSYSDYRKTVLSKSDTIEQKISAKEQDEIDLSKVPSIALHRYRRAFHRYGLLEKFIKDVKEGKADLNAKRLTPGKIVHTYLSDTMRVFWDISEDFLNNESSKTLFELLELQWQNLKKLDDLPKEYKAIAMIDVSSSMNCPNYIPISNALGLGLFMAENNPNPVFKDYFMTFTAEPRFLKVKGHDISEKINNAMELVGYNTDIQKAFEAILERADEANVPAEEMPTHLVVISDMEFDSSAIDGTSVNALKMVDELYDAFGYERPVLVFWNVNGRLSNVPAKDDDKNVLLVSGSSQNIINLMLKGHFADMNAYIDEVISNPRYDFLN